MSKQPKEGAFPSPTCFRRLNETETGIYVPAHVSCNISVMLFTDNQFLSFSSNSLAGMSSYAIFESTENK
ncbi:hypothetical protein AB9F39_37630, partial [Rhizobium leguminosarum]|uniref:hypothetical protein n=1 Tax=Rhizobium leguminosarum TaxID=384 RepID=UPI003F9A6EC6